MEPDRFASMVDYVGTWRYWRTDKRLSFRMRPFTALTPSA
jgi:hypothetical protein